MENRLKIRTAELSDAGRCAEIYRPYVETTAITFEYEAPSAEEFRERMAHTLAKYPYIVAELDGRVVGYAYAGDFVGRAAYDWSVETTVYVEREERGHGVGGALYAELERILREMNVLNLNACIGYPEREDEYLTRNSARFHEHLGYRLVGEFHECGYKFGRWYGIVWMEKHLGAHPPVPAPVIPFPELRRD